MWDKFKAYAWHLKVSVQFTGWLQYLPLLVFSSLFFILSKVFQLMSSWASIFIVVNKLLILFSCASFFTFIFDVVVVKYGLHFEEPFPDRHCNEYLNPFELMLKRTSCRSFAKHMLKKEDLMEILDEVKVQTSPSSLIGRDPIRLEYIAVPLTVWVREKLFKPCIVSSSLVSFNVYFFLSFDKTS
jgi:hypothetical protein